MNVKAMRRNEVGSRRDYVYNYLYQNIIGLSLHPGCALSENEIATQLNVSRTPVREAMIQLAKQDLIETVPQIGNFVSLIDPALVEESRSMRETLEIAAIKEAAEKISAATLLELETSISKQRLMINEGNYREFLIYDDAFHGIIFKSLGKERTWQAIEQMNAQFKRVRVMRLITTTTSEWEEILKEHEGLYAALKNKDATLAQKLMKVHLTKGVIHMDEIKANHPDYFKK
jgi:GntR family transcriptional regulator, rspAB operon transcriptional repressor